MCGIVGFWNKSDDDGRPLGRIVLDMLAALSCRGPDSAGVALYRHDEVNGQRPSAVPPPAQRGGQILPPFPRVGKGGLDFVLRIKLGDEGDLAEVGRRVLKRLEARVRSIRADQTASYLRVEVGDPGDVPELERLIESAADGVEVVSLGRQLEIVKQVGSPENLDATYGVSAFTGWHGLGHTRLSTESRVDLSHSQPFWAHGRPDLAVVHNGHITNYHQLRRRYEQRGVRFYTENDSEVIGVYLAGRMREGLTLDEALKASVTDLDGSFSYFAATADALGFARDSFALKPLLFTEADGFVALATEEIAIRAALPGDYRVCEAQAREVRVWRR